MLPERELNVTVMLPVYYRNVKGKEWMPPLFIF